MGREGPGSNNIWYNPIPEEEEGLGPRQHEGEDRAGGRWAEPLDRKKAASSPTPEAKGGVSRKLSFQKELRRRLSLRSRRHRSPPGHQESESSSANQSVLSRYHLDSSAPPACNPSPPANHGGYLSDGDSPESLPHQPWSDSSRLFRFYANQKEGEDGAETGRSRFVTCRRSLTGRLTVHLLGLADMKRVVDRKVLVVLQVDGVTRARTALLPLQGSALSLDHALLLQLDRNHLLRLIVLSPTPQSPKPTRNRLCGVGGVTLPPLFEESSTQHLCLQLVPRGLLYLKLTLQEEEGRGCGVFGAELRELVEREGGDVPLIVSKILAEIERRGLQVVGLYRLCGSAAAKKKLRERFQTESETVDLSQEPDINVLTGVLKDFLRELPSPLVTPSFYQDILFAMSTTSTPPPARLLSPLPGHAHKTRDLLACLPHPERATLSLLLDHLSLVASFSNANRMSHQNLAVCFGPVLFPGGGTYGGEGVRGRKEDPSSTVDFKHHIEALHFLLQIWPVPTCPISPAWEVEEGEEGVNEGEEVVPRRLGRGGVESPPPAKRYAGDWSDNDYDQVAEGSDEEQKETWTEDNGAGPVEDFLEPLDLRLNLKDFENLIRDFCL